MVSMRIEVEERRHTSRRAMMKSRSPWQGLGEEQSGAQAHDATYDSRGKKKEEVRSSQEETNRIRTIHKAI